MSIFSHITRTLLWSVSAALALPALTSCSDDAPVSDAGRDTRRVRFEVSDASVLSRASARREGSIPLASEEGDTLYLTPRVCEGIDRGGEQQNSRGASVTGANIDDFGVFAAINNGADRIAGYMDNEQVTRANDWAPAHEYLWPADATLHITAYSPYTADPADDGIVAIDTNDDGNVTLQYVTPSDVTRQPDLLRAAPRDASSSPCPLTFDHALTAIRFAAGTQMIPCTVNSITISGVMSAGTLDIETGLWSQLSDATDFTVEPDIEMTAGDDSQFVPFNTPVTSGDNTLMLLPQTLADDATITLDITDQKGRQSRLTASIAGASWQPGTTIVYNLSANPESSSLILEVADGKGNILTSLDTPYTGGTVAYTVRSVSRDGADGTESQVPWKAEFLDSDGNVIDRPDWVKTFTPAGSGTTDCSASTDLPEPIFLAMSDRTRHLRATPDINSTSGHSCYNLANSTGADNIENTANCYVINAPGHYSLPLVYGNAIKNGATNEAAYISTLSATTANKRRALLHFTNHLGNEITDPYIYNNAGCTPGAARLVWEDRLNIVRNITLSDDGTRLIFDIPASSIRQGNALVGVCDSDGNVMWSWHLWLTDLVPADEWVQFADGSTNYSITTHNLGRIFAGDVTRFEGQEVTVRFTQTDLPDGNTPLTATLRLTQGSNTTTTPDFCPYFQWGRKDPIISSVNEYYDSNRQEVKNENIPTMDVGNNHLHILSMGIQHPECFFTGTDDVVRRISPFYLNLWNIDNLVSNPNSVMADNVKSIYDPSPVGMKVPVGNSYKVLADNYSPATYDTSLRGVVVNLAGGATLYFPAFGYRDNKGTDYAIDGSGNNWSAVAGSATTARYLNVTRNGDIQVNNNNALYAFSVRPEKDE